jgi:hypothetical protein
MWRPPGRLQGKKAAISGEIGLFGPLLGPFSSDFRNPVPASGHVCGLADFGGLWRHPHGPRAHFREYTASVQIRSRAAPGRNVAPGGSIEPALGTPASVRCQELGTDQRRLGLPFTSGAAPGLAQG